MVRTMVLADVRRLLVASAVLVLGTLAASPGFARDVSVGAPATLRATADAGAAVVAVVPQGGTVFVHEMKADWTRVSTRDGRMGWIFGRVTGDTLVVGESDPAPFTGADHLRIAVDAPLRGMPAPGARETARIAAGSVVRVIGRLGTWLEIVDAGGRTGWFDVGRVPVGAAAPEDFGAPAEPAPAEPPSQPATARRAAPPAPDPEPDEPSEAPVEDAAAARREDAAAARREDARREAAEARAARERERDEAREAAAREREARAAQKAEARQARQQEAPPAAVAVPEPVPEPAPAPAEESSEAARRREEARAARAAKAAEAKAARESESARKEEERRLARAEREAAAAAASAASEEPPLAAAPAKPTRPGSEERAAAAARREEEKQLADEARAADAQRRDEERRLADEARAAEAERKAEAARAEQEAATLRKAEEDAAREAAKAADAERHDAGKRAETERREAEKRARDEARAAEEQRQADDRARIEAARLAQEEADRNRVPPPPVDIPPPITVEIASKAPAERKETGVSPLIADLTAAPQAAPAGTRGPETRRPNPPGFEPFDDSRQVERSVSSLHGETDALDLSLEPRRSPGSDSTYVDDAGRAVRTSVVTEIAVRVNDEILTNEDYDRRVAEELDDLKRAKPEGLTPDEDEAVRKRILSRLVEQLLLLDQGRILGVQFDKIYETQKTRFMTQAGIKDDLELLKLLDATGRTWDDFRRELLREAVPPAVLYREVMRHVTVPEEDIESHYRLHQEDWADEACVRLREIVLQPEPKERTRDFSARLEAVLARLEGGEDFCAVVRDVSKAPSAADCGLLPQCFKRGMLDEKVGLVAFRMKPGEVEPIQTEWGYHVVRLEEAQARRVRPITEVRDQIVERLRLDAGNEQVRRYIDRLRESARIEIAPQYRRLLEGAGSAYAADRRSPGQ